MVLTSCDVVVLQVVGWLLMMPWLCVYMYVYIYMYIYICSVLIKQNRKMQRKQESYIVIRDFATPPFYGVSHRRIDPHRRPSARCYHRSEHSPRSSPRSGSSSMIGKPSSSNSISDSDRWPSDRTELQSDTITTRTVIGLAAIGIRDFATFRVLVGINELTYR